MSDVSVVFPWASGCPQREKVFAWIRQRYTERHPSWPQIVAEIPAGVWRKGEAVRLGIERAASRIVAVADADVWCENLDAAIDKIARGAPWAMPFRMVVRLNERATGRILDGEDLGAIVSKRSSFAERPYPQIAAGGLVVLGRSAALQVPIDPRFAGWGGEDLAWRDALLTLVGEPLQLKGALYHLWHPPAPRVSRAAGSAESEALRRRYVAARRRPTAMRELIAEVR